MSELAELQIFTEESVSKMSRELKRCSSSSEYLGFVESLRVAKGATVSVPFVFGLDEAPKLSFARTNTGRKVGEGQDISNSILIHKYLGPIKPVAASDRRLWTYLSHVTFAEYSEVRWPLASERWESRVQSRWLMRNSSRSSLVRNGVARLWWAAQMTHDPELLRPRSRATGNEYEYLRILLSHEDAFLALVDRDTGMVPNLLFGILEHIESAAANSNEDYIRRFMKEVVLTAGYRELSALDVDDISRFLDDVEGVVRS